MRHFILITLTLLYCFGAKAQTEIAENLKKKYAINKGFETMVNISIDVPGLIIQPKDISVFYENGKFFIVLFIIIHIRMLLQYGFNSFFNEFELLGFVVAWRNIPIKIVEIKNILNVDVRYKSNFFEIKSS